MSRVAIVTGAAQGIGKGIAERLGRDGFKVVMSDLNEDILLTAAKDLKAKGLDVTTFVGNVALEADQQALVQHAVKTYGVLNVFVNNAGIVDMDRVGEINEKTMDRVFGVNVYGTVFGMQAAAEQMIKQGNGGKIINASSVTAYQAEPDTPIYSASKYAVKSLTASAAKQYGQYGITVTAYAPGVTETELLKEADKTMVERLNLKEGEYLEQMAASFALKRLAQVSDIANVVAFLASSDSDYITGQTIVVDGGMVYQ